MKTLCYGVILKGTFSKLLQLPLLVPKDDRSLLLISFPAGHEEWQIGRRRSNTEDEDYIRGGQTGPCSL
jgi:hypothetical protein